MTCDAARFSRERKLACPLWDVFVSDIIACPLVIEVESGTDFRAGRLGGSTIFVTASFWHIWQLKSPLTTLHCP